MAPVIEAASGALTLLLAFFSALPRFSDLGSDEGGSTIGFSPAPLTVAVNAPVGTVVTTFSVSGGTGSYTYTLVSDALGYFTIVGNQLQVSSSSMAIGTDTIVVQASNGAGDVVNLTTTVTIVPVGYIPTYYIYGF
jgi:hypothetical protein